LNKIKIYEKRNQNNGRENEIGPKGNHGERIDQGTQRKDYKGWGGIRWNDISYLWIDRYMVYHPNTWKYVMKQGEKSPFFYPNNLIQ